MTSKKVGHLYAGGTVLSLFAFMVMGCAAASEGSGEDTIAGTRDAQRSEGMPSESPSTGGEAEALSDDTVFTQTIVTIKDDGTVVTESGPITVAQEKAMVAARKAQEAGIPVQQTRALDPRCATSSEWLYDGAIGNSNMICFSHPVAGYSDVALTTIPRGTISCNGTVYTTYWAGGVYACAGAIPLKRTTNTNSVRSVGTGDGIWYGTQLYNLDGTLTASYSLKATQYTNINALGHFVRTLGRPSLSVARVTSAGA